MSTAKWYVAEGGQTLGPYSTSDLRQALGNGRWTQATLVCPLGETSWKPLSQISELQIGIGSTSAPSRPPAPRRMHEVDYRIFGEEMQFVEVELDPGEGAVAEAGAMMSMSSGIEMQTIFGDGSQNGFMDKMLGAGKRLLTGESLFMTEFVNRGTGKQHVAFASPYPGKILPVQLGELGR